MSNTTLTRKMGWVPDLPDHRDYTLLVKSSRGTLPAKVDLSSSPAMPPIVDQGSIGQCTATASVAALAYAKQKESGLLPEPLSSTFCYYMTRALEGTLPMDGGAQIRNAVKTLVKQGTCWSRHHPSLRWNRKPSSAAVQDALTKQAVAYYRVERNPKQIKEALANGYPVIFGASLFDNIHRVSAKLPVLSFPLTSDGRVGGHAMVIVGYDDTDSHGQPVYIVRNSWGRNFGVKGYFYMAQAYVHHPNLCDDFWVITDAE